MSEEAGVARSNRSPVRFAIRFNAAQGVSLAAKIVFLVAVVGDLVLQTILYASYYAQNVRLWAPLI